MDVRSEREMHVVNSSTSCSGVRKHSDTTRASLHFTPCCRHECRCLSCYLTAEPPAKTGSASPPPLSLTRPPPPSLIDKDKTPCDRTYRRTGSNKHLSLVNSTSIPDRDIRGSYLRYVKVWMHIASCTSHVACRVLAECASQSVRMTAARARRGDLPSDKADTHPS